jgi:hypothetical protein
MKVLLAAIALSAALAASGASAQGVNVNLSGRWQCDAVCLGAPGGFGYITQNGWDLNVVDDVGQPSRAWIDYPGHIWLDRANQGAIFSPDGFALQFDRGTVWQRAPEMPPPLPPLYQRRG